MILQNLESQLGFITKLHAFKRSKRVKTAVFAYITKTCLYDIDPLKPHFYIVKLGFTGVYIIILFSAQKHRLWVLVRTASEAVLTSTDNLCFFLCIHYYSYFYSKHRLWCSLEPPCRGGSNKYPQSMF